MAMEQLVKFLEESLNTTNKSTWRPEAEEMDPHGQLLHRIANNLSIVGIEEKAKVYPEVPLVFYDTQVTETDLVVLANNKLYLIEATISPKEKSKKQLTNLRSRLRQKLTKARRCLWYNFEVYSEGGFGVYWDWTNGDELHPIIFGMHNIYSKKTCERYFRKKYKNLTISS